MKTRRHRAIMWAEKGRKRKETMGLMFHTGLKNNPFVQYKNFTEDILRFFSSFVKGSKLLIKDFKNKK
ncbi:hypothetical protein [Macrococcus capreoli]|uniref:hypothetical protein n=1 Tax=Macrococcus capreoli TaxID=2982690 RepID=UPI003EE61679